MKWECIIHRKGCESVGGGILFGTAAGYAIKKAMKIVTDNLFVGDQDE